MFDYLVEANGLRPVMEEHGLVLPEDLDFIKEQIAGPLDKTAAKGKKVPISYSWMEHVSNFNTPLSDMWFLYEVNQDLEPCFKSTL